MQPDLFESASARMLFKPILGGAFGRGRYAMCSMPAVCRGLHSVRFLVMQPESGTVLSVAEDKVEALADARRILNAADAANDARERTQLELWPDEPVQACETTAQIRPISKRRREVFDRSQGRCHYCGAALTLDGIWHVEHQLPRALGGGDDVLNLVAACVPCNLEKSDSTAIEFVTRTEIGGRP